MPETADSCIEHTSSQLVGPFLDFESPAQRRGKVSRWRYCCNGLNRDIKAQIMVYRQNASHSNQYDQVAESVTNLSFNCADSSCDDNFCWKDTHFKILENDIIGVCICCRDLDYIAQKSHDSTYQGGFKKCTQGQVRYIRINSCRFNSKIKPPLHVYPEIIRGEC